MGTYSTYRTGYEFMSCNSDWRAKHESSALTEEDAEGRVGAGRTYCGRSLVEILWVGLGTDYRTGG